MIISHKHKFIFIKTEKTAGTSFEIALSNICGPEDVITPIAPQDEKYRKSLGFLGRQNFIIPNNQYAFKELAKKILFGKQQLQFYNHISANNVKKRVSPEIWDTYYKFCFERNPFDKVISWYHHNGGDAKHGSILNFIESGEAGRVKGFELYTNNLIPIVDKVYKYEELDEAIIELNNRFNLNGQLSLPPKKAKGNIRKDKRSYKEILNQAEVEWISKIFAREISFFNYKF